MTNFQLDECLNSKEFAKDCNDQALSVAHRFPPMWKGKGIKDPEVLTFFMGGERPFVTIDSAILDHVASVPDLNPGIIIINNAVVTTAKCLRLSDVRRILKKFKLQIDDWHSISWRNSIVRLTQEDVRISHVESGRVIEDAYLLRSEQDCQQEVKTLLATNAAKSQPSLPGEDG